MHWAADLIGRRWKPTFDCRALVRECIARRALPPLPEVEEVHASPWRVVEDGQADDLITMNGPRGLHVGFMTQANGRLGVLHANGYESATGPVGMVQFQSLAEATADGYGRFKFWRATTCMK